MSRLKRSIERSLRELQDKPDRLKDMWDDMISWWGRTWINDTYYKVLNFKRNATLFTKLAWNWRPWDYNYTLKVLTTLLEKQAIVLKGGWNVRSEEVSRRCSTAAGLIDRAYSRDVDKVIVYLMRKNPMFFKEVEGSKCSEMLHKEVTPKRIYDGMYEVARKREERDEAQAKKEAWEYFNKYVEHFWD